MPTKAHTDDEEEAEERLRISMAIVAAVQDETVTTLSTAVPIVVRLDS